MRIGSSYFGSCRNIMYVDIKDLNHQLLSKIYAVLQRAKKLHVEISRCKEVVELGCT